MIILADKELLPGCKLASNDRKRGSLISSTDQAFLGEVQVSISLADSYAGMVFRECSYERELLFLVIRYSYISVCISF